ncbi:MAG: Precorrin-3B methylase [Chloroflexaceae bacterium]|nr:Precorrin-3B methylase [Chloroflexaceae bacterium]
MKEPDLPLSGDALIKEVCRRIRVARSYWDAHNNVPCRRERDRALALYNTLTKDQKTQIPQVLRVWLRYRSEKYFGPTAPRPAAPKKSRAKPAQS